MREWRHVRLLKRMGRGHSASGVKGTAEVNLQFSVQPGPIPQINLLQIGRRGQNRNSSSSHYGFPSDTWPNYRWIYALFIGIDANFRLKRVNVSTDARDPGLNHGYAYVVEERKYKKYLERIWFKDPYQWEKHLSQPRRNQVSSMRGGKGKAATGLWLRNVVAMIWSVPLLLAISRKANGKYCLSF